MFGTLSRDCFLFHISRTIETLFLDEEPQFHLIDMSNPIITPNRKTIVTFDAALPGPTQQLFGHMRFMSEIGAGGDPGTENVGFVPEVGWQLKGWHWDAGELQESSEGLSAIMKVADGRLQVAPGIEEFDTYRQTTELTGVTFDPSVPATGSTMIQKRVAASGSWADAAMFSDQTAFPPPEPDNDPAGMDRIARSTANHKPTTQLTFSFFAPGSGIQASRSLVTFYFTGPAGSTKEFWGIGQYALKLRGDGTALLFERGKSGDTDPTSLPNSSLEWKRRFTFQWAENARAVFNSAHQLLIASDTAESATGQYRGSKIVFMSSSIARPGNSLVEILRTMAITAIKQQSGLVPVYNVPNLRQGATVEGPIRIDARRDIRVIANVAEQKFVEEGVLLDSSFSFPYVPRSASAEDLIYIEAFGSIPDGTAIGIELLDSSGVVVPGGVTTVTASYGVQKTYPIPAGNTSRYFRVRFLLSGDGTKSPTLTKYMAYRYSTFAESDAVPVETPQRAVEPSVPRSHPSGITITNGGRSPEGDRAQIKYEDLGEDYPLLRVRSGIPIKIETEYDEIGNRATLFQGYVSRAMAQKLVGNDPDRDFPDPEARSYYIDCAGEWARLNGITTPRRLEFSEVVALGLPGASTATFTWKVTRIIRVLLAMAYPDEFIDIPDLDIRLLATDAQEYILNPGNKILDILPGLAQDYFGGWLHFDVAAGDRGKWRLGLPRPAPFTILARFYVNHPGEGVHPVDHRAYPDVTIIGQESRPVKATFIRKGTHSSWVEKPEGNVVEVYAPSAGSDTANAGGSDASMPTVVLFNPHSFNALNLEPSDPNYPDPNHPDYIGFAIPIRVTDKKISTIEAATMIGRRVYDAACHALDFQQFEAPLLLITEVADEEQVRPRQLRFYDPVEIEQTDGSFVTYIVVDCNPTYVKDHVQMAQYTLVRSSAMDEIQSSPFANGLGSIGDRKDLANRLYEKRTGESHPGFPTASSAMARNQLSSWMGLPKAVAQDVQILDPSDPNFGKFYFIPGFSRIGGPDIMA